MRKETPNDDVIFQIAKFIELEFFDECLVFLQNILLVLLTFDNWYQFYKVELFQNNRIVISKNLVFSWHVSTNEIQRPYYFKASKYDISRSKVMPNIFATLFP